MTTLVASGKAQKTPKLRGLSDFGGVQESGFMGLILVSASEAIGLVRVSEKCITASYVAECLSIICNYSQLAISSHQIILHYAIPHYTIVASIFFIIYVRTSFHFLFHYPIRHPRDPSVIFLNIGFRV